MLTHRHPNKKSHIQPNLFSHKNFLNFLMLYSFIYLVNCHFLFLCLSCLIKKKVQPKISLSMQQNCQNNNSKL
jgi:hypothetical protein